MSKFSRNVIPRRRSGACTRNAALPAGSRALALETLESRALLATLWGPYAPDAWPAEWEELAQPKPQQAASGIAAAAHVVPATDPGETIGEAYPIGTLGATHQFEEAVNGTTDPSDYYSFDVAEVSRVEITLSGLSAAAGLKLWTVAGSPLVIESHESFHSAPHFVVEDLAPDEDYFIEVLALAPAVATSYTLTIEAAALVQNPANDPGNDTAGAYPLNELPLGESQPHLQFVGTFDPSDFYQFSVGQLSDVQITLSGLSHPQGFLSEPAALRLWTVDGSPILLESHESYHSDEHFVAEDLAPGHPYFIEVSQLDQRDNTSYTLTIETAPIDQNPATDPGDTTTTAHDLGMLSPVNPQAEAANFVGTFDATDVYRFELAQTALVTFSLLDRTEGTTMIGAGLEVFRIVEGAEESLGSIFAFSFNTMIEIDLQPGGYYARVATPEPDPEPDENTRYRLIVDPDFSPSVLAIYANGTSWPQAFQQSGPTPGPAGVRFPTGGGNQLLALPWLGVDQLSLVFSEAVVVAADDLVLSGLDVAAHPLAAGFAYDADTLTATWTFATPLGSDRYTIHLASHPTTGVRDLDGNALDGEWENPDSIGDPNGSQTSGDGSPGGDLVFHFNVLLGDVNGDGTVAENDVSIVRAWVGSVLGGLYNRRADVNTNTGITTADVGLVRLHLGETLPPLEEAQSLASGQPDPQAADAVFESLAGEGEEAPADRASVSRPLLDFSSFRFGPRDGAS